MVIAVLLRGAAKRCKSMEELWQTYDDVGCDLVRDKVRQKKFDRVMSYLVFADYSGLARDAGDPTKIDILARVEPLLHLMGERCRELFETSQTCAVDESVVTCKSRRTAKSSSGTRRSRRRST